MDPDCHAGGATALRQQRAIGLIVVSVAEEHRLSPVAPLRHVMRQPTATTLAKRAMRRRQRRPARVNYVLCPRNLPAGWAVYLAAKEDDQSGLGFTSGMGWGSPILPCAHHQPKPGRRRAVNAPKPKGARKRAGLTVWRRSGTRRQARKATRSMPINGGDSIRAQRRDRRRTSRASHRDRVSNAIEEDQRLGGKCETHRATLAPGFLMCRQGYAVIRETLLLSCAPNPALLPYDRHRPTSFVVRV